MSDAAPVAASLARTLLVAGGGQALSVLILVLRMKLVAVLLGPLGVGVLTTLQSLHQLLTTGGALGLQNAGLRAIAGSESDDARRDLRRTLLTALGAQGAVVAGLAMLASAPLASLLLDSGDYRPAVVAVGVGAFLALLAQGHLALLRARREARSVAASTVFGAAVATLVGVPLLPLWGAAGVAAFIVVQPLATLAFARRREQKPRPARGGRADASRWRSMLVVGLAFMAAGLASMATLLLLRAEIVARLGLPAAGQFGAAWGLSVTYLGLILTALTSDYFPRLSAATADPERSRLLIEEQSRLGLIVGGPMLLVMAGAASWIVPILYSREFAVAADLLAWQALGNVFKLAAWPLSYAVIARGRAGAYFLLEASFAVGYTAAVLYGIEAAGLIAAGPAFVFAYALYLGLARWLVGRDYHFGWSRVVLGLLFGYGALLSLLIAVRMVDEIACLVLTAVLTPLCGVAGLRALLRRLGDHAALEPLRRVFAWARWPVEAAPAASEAEREPGSTRG